MYCSLIIVLQTTRQQELDLIYISIPLHSTMTPVDLTAFAYFIALYFGAIHENLYATISATLRWDHAFIFSRNMCQKSRNERKGVIKRNIIHALKRLYHCEEVRE